MHLQLLLRTFLSAVLFVSVLEAARPLCTARNCASISKRNALTQFQRDNISVIKATPLDSRALDNPADPGRYVKNAVDALATGNKIYNDRSSSTTSTSLFRSFLNRRNEWASSFQIGLKKLTGCITVVIISNRGIYAAHFFEDTAMDPQNTATYAPNLLRSGSGNRFDSIAAHWGDLNSSPYGQDHLYPEVFVITPIKINEDPVDAGSRPADTRPAIEIGLWPNTDRIHQIPYYPLNKDNTQANQMRASNVSPDFTRLRTGPEGKVLFEYNKDANNVIELRLWTESTKTFEWRM